MLDLRVGDTVEVKSREEILATLDLRGALDALPFMPEMLRYCGRRYKVYKRADKTCEYVDFPRYSTRRMFHTVHLEGLRCDGEHHDGCDASCLLFWKEVWLKRVDGRTGVRPSGRGGETIGGEGSRVTVERGCTVETLMVSTKRPKDSGNPGPEKYSCQGTEIVKASRELKWWDLRQYYRDLRSGNVCLKHFAKWTPLAVLNWAHERFRGWRIYPFMDPRQAQREKTPTETLNLQPGESVRIRPLKEIMQTLDANMKNRGLLFAKEMVPYCGKTAQVLKEVQRIINEANGEMIVFNTKSFILEEVICTSYLSDKRLFCPRSMYPYWKEIWLRRV